ncbi:hypothetical protein COCNU_scaffold000040G000010 [Cocos nucifera]|nr:hypothetical protein [Cocos nucifera]
MGASCGGKRGAKEGCRDRRSPPLFRSVVGGREADHLAIPTFTVGLHFHSAAHGGGYTAKEPMLENPFFFFFLFEAEKMGPVVSATAHRATAGSPGWGRWLDGRSWSCTSQGEGGLMVEIAAPLIFFFFLFRSLNREDVGGLLRRLVHSRRLDPS